MTAFDRAWALLKMPVVPESIVWNKNFGVFGNDWRNIRGGIGSNDSPLASMRAWTHGGEQWNAHEAFTEPSHRRRGYSKELYDFVAMYLEGAGGYLLPDEEQTHYAEEMWKKYAPDGVWPSNRIGGRE